MIKIDQQMLDLLVTYNKPGPRYTSYPTAPLFSSEYDDKRFEVDLITNNHENISPISLYLHIPFCDTLCYFCGCTTVITKDRSRIRTYIDALKKEIARTAIYVSHSREIVQMHWGGGSPSYLAPDEIRELSDWIRERFRFSEDAEISVEIDPRGLTFDHFIAFRSAGVNRISVGVQDFDERVQRAVNRIQPEAITRKTLDWAREFGINNINVDLMYGLPLQNASSFGKTLETVLELDPNRLAVFNFAYVPWMKAQQKLLHPEDLPSAETKLELLKTSIETLTGAGYEYIGMDHFAKPDDELTLAQKTGTLHRNFQGYSTRAGADLYAFGMSAISHFGNIYAQNLKTLPEYIQAVNQQRFPTAVGYRMTSDDQVRKFVITRLMCDLEVEKEEVEELFRITFDEYFDKSLDELADFQRLGLVKHTLSKITVEGNGRLVLRNIAMCFDAHLKRLQSSKPTFSQTV
jgi:oxygen-independent coproporphyrinogen-3 oxidase